MSEWRRQRDASLLEGKNPGDAVGGPSREQAEIAKLPALLFVALVEADLGVVLTGPFPGIALSAIGVTRSYATYAALRRHSLGDATIGALGAAFVNGGSLGIPIAQYILGDAAYAVPLILF